MHMQTGQGGAWVYKGGGQYSGECHRPNLSLYCTNEVTSMKFKLQSFVRKKVQDLLYILHFSTLYNIE